MCIEVLLHVIVLLHIFTHICYIYSLRVCKCKVALYSFCLRGDLVELYQVCMWENPEFQIVIV